MFSVPVIFIIFITLVALYFLWDFYFTPEHHIIDRFFIDRHLKKAEDFKFATIEQYMDGSFKPSYHIGDSIYTPRGEGFKVLSGSRIQDVIDDIYWHSKMPKGSLTYEVLHPDTILIKRVEDFHADKQTT